MKKFLRHYLAPLAAVATITTGVYSVWLVDILMSLVPKPAALVQHQQLAPPVIDLASTYELQKMAPDDTKYRGCWAGMGGGLLKITENRIYDLGSKESSSITLLELRKPVDTSGLQTGVVHLFEARRRFPRSFLNRVIKLSFNSDETVVFTTYGSTGDYFDDVVSGQGLFQRIDCLTFRPMHAMQ